MRLGLGAGQQGKVPGLAAGGRLVECLAKDWDAILRGAPDKDGNEDHYDMFIGRDPDGWKMYR